MADRYPFYLEYPSKFPLGYQEFFFTFLVCFVGWKIVNKLSFKPLPIKDNSRTASTFQGTQLKHQYITLICAETKIITTKGTYFNTPSKTCNCCQGKSAPQIRGMWTQTYMHIITHIKAHTL